LLFGCQNEGLRCGRTLYVNSFRLHGLANVTDHAIVGDVNAFFAAIQADLHERNGNPVMFFTVLLYRAEMVMWADLFERRDERSSLCYQIHKASVFYSKSFRLRTALTISWLATSCSHPVAGLLGKSSSEARAHRAVATMSVSFSTKLSLMH